MLSADEILSRAESRRSKFEFTDNTVCVSFRLPAKKRYRRLIAAASLHVADFLRVGRRIIGGGAGCFWFEQDVTGVSRHAFEDFHQYCKAEIVDGGFWNRLYINEIWAESKALDIKFEVMGSDGKDQKTSDTDLS